MVHLRAPLTDKPPPEKRPPRWSAGDKFAAATLGLWLACWIAAVIILALR